MSALRQWSKRHSEDGGDEMRTGGGLSFNGGWSSPVDRAEQSSANRAPRMAPGATGTPHPTVLAQPR